MTDLRNRILSGELPTGTKLPTEKELRVAYGVSGNTVREAIRGLATSLLIDVRHGSGAFVTADVNTLMAETLRSTIKMEDIGVEDVLATYGAVNGVAAELAATHASDEQLAHMQDALDAIPAAATSAEISAALTRFRKTLADASGNRLLGSICHFLASIQIGLVEDVAGDSYATHKKLTLRLTKQRQALLDAVRIKDPAASRAAASTYQKKVVAILAEGTEPSQPR